jgi:hypothetical protein
MRKISGTTNTVAPWVPANADPADLESIKAITRGLANEDQQIRFVEWLKRATGVAEMEFRPDSERSSAFAAGKRFVGLQFFSLAQSRLPEKEKS